MANSCSMISAGLLGTLLSGTAGTGGRPAAPPAGTWTLLHRALMRRAALPPRHPRIEQNNPAGSPRHRRAFPFDGCRAGSRRAGDLIRAQPLSRTSRKLISPPSASHSPTVSPRRTWSSRPPVTRHRRQDRNPPPVWQEAGSFNPCRAPRRLWPWFRSAYRPCGSAPRSGRRRRRSSGEQRIRSGGLPPR